MADSTSTPGEQTNQPAAAAAAPTTPVAAPVAGTPPPSTPAVPAKPTETPPAAEKPTEGEPAKPAEEPPKPAEGEKPPAPVVPESYDIKLPEELVKAGATLDKQLVATMTPVFKELGLSGDAAQKLANAAIAYQKGLPQAMLARDLEVTLKDPEIGGLNWPKTQANIKLALGAFTTVQERQWLERAGIGNRLEFVRVFDRIGRAMAAAGDTAVRGSPDGAQEMSAADRLYAKSAKPA